MFTIEFQAFNIFFLAENEFYEASIKSVTAKTRNLKCNECTHCEGPVIEVHKRDAKDSKAPHQVIHSTSPNSAILGLNRRR